MEQFVKTHGLSVDPILFDFVNAEALPGTDLDGDRFWSALAAIIDKFAPQNKSLLLKRDKLQSQIDAWHAERRGNALDLDAYRSFLSEMETNPKSLELLKGVVELSRRLQLGVTIEGVETEQQFRLLAETVHPDYIQGFLFGAPLSKRGIAAMIQAIRPLKDATRRTSATTR